MYFGRGLGANWVGIVGCSEGASRGMSVGIGELVFVGESSSD
jgi:hypothetical protein